MKTSHSTRSKLYQIGLLVISFGATFILAIELQAAVINGESLFKQHCTSCHTDGSNIIKPDKSLSRKDREKHGVKTGKDIVKLMRKPGEGMTTFDKKEVSDAEAKAIAEYILKTFK